jgi:hypothetical protein
MITYNVVLGIDRAAQDTGERMTMMVRESDPLQAAIKAERLADRRLLRPEVEYTHAMSVTPVVRPVAAMPLAIAA